MDLQVYPEGTHFLIPLIERAITYDVRARPSTITSTSGSRDLQMVNLGLRVLTKPNSARLAEVYRRLGVDYSERVLPSLIHEVRALSDHQFHLNNPYWFRIWHHATHCTDA